MLTCFNFSIPKYGNQVQFEYKDLKLHQFHKTWLLSKNCTLFFWIVSRCNDSSANIFLL